MLRDVAGGRTRFDQLVAETGISRKVLTRSVSTRSSQTASSRAAATPSDRRDTSTSSRRWVAVRCPVLSALQEFGDTWLLGDGQPDAGAATDSNEAARVSSLVGEAIPRLHALDPVTDAAFTVVYCYPGNAFPGADEIPGGIGCTLESCTYRDRLGEFATWVPRSSGSHPTREPAGGVRRGERHPLPAPVGRRPRADYGPAAADLPRRRTTRLKRQTLGRRPRPCRARHALPHPRRHRLGRGRPASRP